MHKRPAFTVACLAALLALPAQAQIADFLKALPKLAPPGAGIKPEPLVPRQGVEDAAVVSPPSNYESEMAPDLNCSRPREKFNIAEKLTEYGGTAATLRLQRLLASGQDYGTLKPEDKQLLRYMAQTSIWVPPEVEVKLATVFQEAGNLFGRRVEPLTELQTLALEDVQKRMQRLRAVVSEYPAEIRLDVDKQLADGAFARFGGLIQISERFLNGLGDAGPGADFLLAHEISHVYKRHALKQVQFQLISSSEGWKLARQVLSGLSGAPLGGGGTLEQLGNQLTTLSTVPALIEFTRSVQTRYGKEQEFEADACATVWLKAAGTDPVQAWTQYQAALGASAQYSEEHPSTEDRQQRFMARASGDNAATEKLTDVGTVKTGGKKIVSNSAKKK